MQPGVAPDAAEAPHEADVGRLALKKPAQLVKLVNHLERDDDDAAWNESVAGMTGWLASATRLDVSDKDAVLRQGGQVVERAVLLGCYEEAAGSTPPFADGSRACTSSLTTARAFGQSVHDDAAAQRYVLLTGYALLSTPATQWKTLADMVAAAPSIASQLGAKAASELPHALASHWHQLAMKEMIDASMEADQLRSERTVEESVEHHLPNKARYEEMMQAVRESGKVIIESLQGLLHLVCLWSVSGMLVDPQSASVSDVSEEDERDAVAFFVDSLRDGTARAPALERGQTPSKVPMIAAHLSIDHDAARGRSLKYGVYDATLGTAVAFTSLLTTSLEVSDEERYPTFVTGPSTPRFPFSFAFAAEIAMLGLQRPDKLNHALAVYANAVRVAIKEHDLLARMSYSDPLEVMTAGWAMGMVALRRLQHAALVRLDVAAKIKLALGLEQPPSPEVTLVVACVWLGAQGDMATRDRLEKQGVAVGGADGEYLPSAFAKMLEPQFHSMLKPTTMVAGMQDNVLWMMWRSAFCASEAAGFEAWLLVRRLAELSSKTDVPLERRQHVLGRRRALPMAAAAMAVLFAGPCAAGLLQQNAGEALALVSCYAAVPRLIYPIMHLFWVNTSAWEWMLRFGDLDPEILLAPLYVEHFSTAFGTDANGDLTDLAADVLRSMGWPLQMDVVGPVRGGDGVPLIRPQSVSEERADDVEVRVHRFFRVVQLALERAVTRPMLRFAAGAGGDWDRLMKVPVAAALPTQELLALAEGVQRSVGSQVYDVEERTTSVRYSVQTVPFEIWLAMLTSASLTPAHATSPRAAEVICELCAQVQMLDFLGTTRQPLVRGPGGYDQVFDSEFAKRVDAEEELKARESVRLLMAAQATNALTASVAHLMRRAEISGLTEAQHNFLVVAYLTGSRVAPIQLYARCVTSDTAKCVHMVSEERNMTDWKDFLAVPNYDYWAADYHQSPHAPEAVAAAHMSRGFKNAISRAFERRFKARMTDLASPSDAQTLRDVSQAMDEQKPGEGVSDALAELVRNGEKANESRLKLVRDEESMTPEIAVEAEAIKTLHTMAVGPHWHTLPKLDEITQRIVKYIVGRKAEAEITERCADIVTLQCEVTACCFVPKVVVAPFETADFRRLYPDTAEE